MRYITLFLLLLLFLCPTIFGEEIPANIKPPLGISVIDTPYDSGNSITVNWQKSADDLPNTQIVESYEIMRSESENGVFTVVGRKGAGETKYVDASTHNGTKYFYKIAAIGFGKRSESAISEGMVSTEEWIDLKKANLFIMAFILSFFIIWFIERVKSGKKFYVRKIAGLEAINEAVGRATEMGKPILFIPGILDINDMQTLASITILGKIAKTIAEYDSKLLMPNIKALVMVTAREVVKEAYLEAGRPDAYDPDSINYITDDQFGYVSGVNGIIVREKPAACFYLGAFYAESLILAETGYSAGSIQIAGTAAPSQLPFFIAACDYTLIGEELFAASAYLSGDAKQLGSLKAQDVGKFIAMASILFGSLTVTLATLIDNPFLNSFSKFFVRLFSVV